MEKEKAQLWAAPLFQLIDILEHAPRVIRTRLGTLFGLWNQSVRGNCGEKGLDKIRAFSGSWEEAR